MTSVQPPHLPLPGLSVRSHKRFASPSTISKDATQGHAGEETQILSDLADRARSSKTFRQETGVPGPSIVPPPAQFDPPAPAQEMPPGQPPPPAIKKTDEDSEDEVLDEDPRDPFITGTKFAYQVLYATSGSTAPKLPRDWNPTWSSTYNIRPKLDVDKLESDAGTAAMFEASQLNEVTNGSHEHQNLESKQPGQEPQVEHLRDEHYSVS